MARQENLSQIKAREEREQRQRQHTLRRNQIIFGIISFFLILSMVLSLISF